MADTKFSALTAVSAALLTHEWGVNEAASSKRVTAAQLKTLVNDAPLFGAGSASANSKPEMTSGTLLTTPEAGALEYDGTSFYKTIDVTSGRGLESVQQMFRLAANGGALGPTIADFFGANSAFPTVLNGVYEFIFHVYFLKTTAGQVTFTITNTQAYTNLVGDYLMTPVGGIAGNGATTKAGIVTNTTAAIALPITGSLTLSTNHCAIIRVLAECGTAGNIRLRVTSSAGTVTPLRGSFYTVRRLPAANVGTFVA